MKTLITLAVFLSLSFQGLNAQNGLISIKANCQKEVITQCSTNDPYSFEIIGGIDGYTINFSLPYGVNLNSVFITFELAENYSTNLSNNSSVDFDSNNDGQPDMWTMSIFNPEGGQNDYSVMALINPANDQNDLINFVIPTATSLFIDKENHLINAILPYDSNGDSFIWLLSPYSQMFLQDPLQGNTTETCSGLIFPFENSEQFYNLWIRSEDRSLLSHWVIQLNRLAPNPFNNLVYLYSNCFKQVTCGIINGFREIATVSENTVRFDVYYGVTSVIVTEFGISPMATSSIKEGDELFNGSTFTITSQSGTPKTYTVEIIQEPIRTGNQLLTFGFNSLSNPCIGYTGSSQSYIGGLVNQTDHSVKITLPFNACRDNLKPLFSVSDLANVYIKKIDGSQICQISDQTFNDFTNPVTYVIVAEDGTSSEYVVTVKNELPLTGNDLVGFKILGIERCGFFGFEEPGVYDNTNISVSVKNGTDLSGLQYYFTLSPGASSDQPCQGFMDFSQPVPITITSQAGVGKTYTVTVIPRPQNNEKRILQYWLDADQNSLLVKDAIGTVNEETKTIEIWIPWEARKSILAMTGSFVLNDRAILVKTFSNGAKLLQRSGITPNDFRNPNTLQVYAEDCSIVNYTITVNITPNTDTRIRSLSFTTGCGCNLVTRIDPVMHRVYVKVPHSTDITNLALNTLSIEEEATSFFNSQEGPQNWNTPQNYSIGPVVITVTAPDGITKADWSIMVENPICQDAEVTSFQFPTGQIGQTIINNTTQTIDVTMVNETDISNLIPQITTSCGSTFCLNPGDCGSVALDFSGSLSHAFSITSEDPTIVKTWTIRLHFQDLVKPQVVPITLTGDNCLSEIMVQTNEPGNVFIVHESAIDFSQSPPKCLYNLNDWSNPNNKGAMELTSNRLGAYATATEDELTVKIWANSISPGSYRAYSVDNTGNISEMSDVEIVLQPCTVETYNLGDLRSKATVFTFILRGEVLITYEENRPAGNWKYVQDAGFGILIEDRYHVLPENYYGVGTGLSNLKGKLDKTGATMIFIPDPDCQPEISSTGNIILPIELTYDEFKTQCYEKGTLKYESMLVKITTPIKIMDDYDQDNIWKYDNLDLVAYTSSWATGNNSLYYNWFIQSVFNSELIGTNFPTAPITMTGVRTNVNWGSANSPLYYGLLTPRGQMDIQLVDQSILSTHPELFEITNILPGSTGETHVFIFNDGTNDLNITGITLTGNSSDNEFEITSLPSLPYRLGSWERLSIPVRFLPKNWGDEGVILKIDSDNGQTLNILVNGKTPFVITIPYTQTFNPPFPLGSSLGSEYQGWMSPDDNSLYLQNYVTNAWVSFDGSYVMNMRPRKSVGGKRQPTWLITPGLVVSGSDPVITWVETAATVVINGIAKNSPRNVYISTDRVNWALVDSYKTSSMPDGMFGQGWRSRTYSLSDYIGQTIWWKWELISVNNEYTYWCIDNISVKERVTGPVVSTDPIKIDFGTVQAGNSKTINVRILNSGFSLLNITGLELNSPEFRLVDVNSYPVEVTALDGSWAYSNGVLTPEINVPIIFEPTGAGIKTASLIVHYGWTGEKMAEIPLNGYVVSCADALEAVVGENWAPKQDIWFKYTAQTKQRISISSCHPNQNAHYNQFYSWDTYLSVYDGCNGNLIGQNDDMETFCTYNRASSMVDINMNAGQTIYFFWAYMFPTAQHAEDGFYFTIEATVPDLNVDFTSSKTIVQTGEAVDFTDLSTFSPISWWWEFEGAEPAISDQQNPQGITYNNTGVYEVTLTVSNGFESKTLARELYVSVISEGQEEQTTWTDNFTIGGFKAVTSGADNGWTFTDRSSSWMPWQVRNFGISGCQVQEGPMPSTTGSSGYLVLPADEYNCRNGSQTGNLVDAYAQSPSIDCSNLDVVVLNFEQRFKVCCTTPIMEVQVSADGGNTWRSYNIFKDRALDAIIGNPVEKVELNITEVASRQSDVRIRFYWKGSSAYYWMIDDMSVGGYIFCQPMDIAIQGASTVYYGYAPMASTTLVPVISGGTGPFTYFWNTSSTGSTIKVSPIFTTEYHLEVTDANGCKGSATYTVNVEDVRCGNKMDKVIVCVNDKNPHTICISPDAVPAQLALGNYLGSCKKNGLPLDPDEIPSELSFSMYPNPSYDKVTMEISGISSVQMFLIVKDVLGRTVIFEQIPTTTADLKHEIRLYQSGMYHVILQTEKENVTKQLVILK